jgi:hypothetical protein
MTSSATQGRWLVGVEVFVEIPSTSVVVDFAVYATKPLVDDICGDGEAGDFDTMTVHCHSV